MPKFELKRLVRDKIAEQIKASGDESVGRILEDTDFIRELKRKILEEARELDTAAAAEVLSELADIEELVLTLADLHGGETALTQARAAKNAKAGGFTRRYFIETATLRPDSPWLKYYLDR